MKFHLHIFCVTLLLATTLRAEDRTIRPTPTPTPTPQPGSTPGKPSGILVPLHENYFDDTCRLF